MSRPNAHFSIVGATWALFLGLAFLMMGNGLQSSLVGLRAESEGFGTTVVGIVMSLYFVGFLFGTRVANKALLNVGHIRVFAALASIASSSVLVYTLAVHPVTWGLMRFATGMCFAGLYVVVEGWLNDMATNANRGRILAMYMVISIGGVGAGQLFLNSNARDSSQLFIVSSILVSLALVPVALSGASAPPGRVTPTLPLRRIWALVPTGLITSFLSGIANGALFGMGAAYASAAGLSPGAIGFFVLMPMIGGVAFQFPIGALSDRLPRRGVIFAVTAVGVAVPLIHQGVEPGGTASYALMLALGGVMFPLYSLGIAYTNDWLPSEEIVGAAGQLVFTNGLGAVAGPFLAAGLISAFGNQAFFLAIAAAHGILLAYLGFRIVSRDGLPVDRQADFVPYPSRASAVAAQLLVRRRKRNGSSQGH
ncbi:MAG: MFS transporter [Acidimicrobiales bacterium]|nr:MFS transporter [Acidimicrobiales bacterium]